MVMEVISRGTGRGLSSTTLNPNAPPFVPLEFRAVEDFSDRWWELVTANPGFRDYWLRECFQPPQEEEEIADPLGEDVDDLVFFDAMEDLISPRVEQVEIKKESSEKILGKEMIRWGSEKWHGKKAAVSPKYATKAPKIVSVKLSPRNIQQPR